MNAKAKGTRAEHKSIKLLEGQGYKCTRAAASLGTFDLVAIGADDVLLVQCKSNRWPGASEMEAIRTFRAPALARKLIHRWRDRQPEPDIREVPDREGENV
jgi:Holliday junction resolvase